MFQLLAATLLVVAATPAAQAPRVTVRPAAANNGDVVRISVRTGARATAVSITAGDRQVPARRNPSGDTWTGLLGIDVEQRTTRIRIVASIQRGDDARTTVAATLPVTFRPLPTRRITVARQFTEPTREQLERAEREATRLAELFRSDELPYWRGAFVAPVDSAIVSNFGRRSIVNGKPGSIHVGVDLAAPAGTPVYAPAAGRVVLAEELFFSGNTVVIDHGGQLFSLLAHLSTIDVVEGAIVEQGALIGASGATGRVTGPHLHWTVRLTGARVNPLSLLAATVAAPLPSATRKSR